MQSVLPIPFAQKKVPRKRESRLSWELNEFRRSVAIANTTNTESIRFLASTRDSVFRMRCSCICICIIDACKVIRTRCTCVYIFTYVCKCTWYNMHYRSRATPRQFSTSLWFEVLNRNCCARYIAVVIVIACPPALLGMLNYYLLLNRIIDKIIVWQKFFYIHRLIMRCTILIIIINKFMKNLCKI